MQSSSIDFIAVIEGDVQMMKAPENSLEVTIVGALSAKGIQYRPSTDGYTTTYRVLTLTNFLLQNLILPALIM